MALAAGRGRQGRLQRRHRLVVPGPVQPRPRAHAQAGCFDSGCPSCSLAATFSAPAVDAPPRPAGSMRLSVRPTGPLPLSLPSPTAQPSAAHKAPRSAPRGPAAPAPHLGPWGRQRHHKVRHKPTAAEKFKPEFRARALLLLLLRQKKKKGGNQYR